MERVARLTLRSRTRGADLGGLLGIGLLRKTATVLVDTNSGEDESVLCAGALGTGV